MKNARETALLILYAVFYEGAYTNLEIKDAFLKNSSLSDADKAFAARIVYGVTKQKLLLDHIISLYSSVKPKKISKYINIILMMGIYQIRSMDRVPVSAAVNESVKLAKRYGHGASAGFVNGVLRAAAKGEKDVFPDGKEGLCIRYSYPSWLADMFIRDLGYEETEKLFRAMNKESVMTLRVNTYKTSAEELCKNDPSFKISPVYDKAVYASGFDLAASDEYKNGLVIAQDISAMMASVVLDPKKGETVLDMCAAPGGKTTHIAELMKNEGRIEALDIHEHKIKLIKENADRMGFEIISAKCADSAEYDKKYEGAFDKILADVPCSGLGIIKRKPDIKWKEPDFSGIADTAKKILINAARYLKPGGEMVFSTCTLNKDENENRLFWLLEHEPELEAVGFYDILPSGMRSEEAKKGYITFYPHINDTDGFFIAKVKRCKK